MLGELAGTDGHGGEVLDFGVGEQGGVREEEHAGLSEIFKVGGDDEGYAEDFGGMGLRFDGIDEGPEVGGGDGLIAANDGVRLTVLDHERAKVVGAGHDFRRLAELAGAVAVHVFHALAEEIEVGCLGRIDDVDEFHGDSVFGGHGTDVVAIAQQDGGDDLFLDEAGGCADDAEILAFGENHAFGVAPELFDEVYDDRVGWLQWWERFVHEGARAWQVRISLV